MPKTLLLADDSVTIQKVVGITFANEDVELVTVDNGTDALARARDLKPDMILADVAMPGLGGYELCAAIRRDPQLAQTPVLLLTGTFETYDEQKGQAVGASGHIAKPFEARALIGQFYALIGQEPAPQPAAPEQPAAAPQPAPQVAPAVAPFAPAPVQAPPVQAPPVQAPPVQTPVAAPDTPIPQPAPPPVVPFEPAPAPAHAETAPVQPAAPAPAMPVVESDGPSTMSDLPNTDFGNTVPPVMPAPSPLTADPDLVVAPVVAPAPAAAPADDFSFDDLDFNTPDTNTDTGIFGEDSQSGVATAPAPATADAYGETAFLDPQAARRAVAQGPGEPHEPDPMADTIPEDPFADTSTLQRPMIDQLNPDPASIQPPVAPAPAVAAPVAPIPEAVPWSDPEPVTPAPAAPIVEASPIAEVPPVVQPAPLVEAAPVAPAPLAEPMNLQPLADHDTEPLDLPPLEAEPLPDDPGEAATVFEPEAFAEAAARHGQAPTTVTAEPTAALFATQTEPTADLFAPEPPPEVAPAEEPPLTVAEPLPDTNQVHLDPTLVRESIEKVAWEAFGTLQDQLVRDVMSKAEAIVWEVVPQVTERLIREEIARIKADADE